MTFDEILEQALDVLRRRGRVSYAALKRQFALDDEYLADLKSELVEVLAVAADKDGKMLVWTGEEQRAGSGEQEATSDEGGREQPQLPRSTPRDCSLNNSTNCFSTNSCISCGTRRRGGVDARTQTV